LAEISESLQRAACWFLHSGIQEPNGGVARYYRTDLSANARVSTEITGYTVSALVYLHEMTGDERLLDAAVRAGRFLARQAWDSEQSVFPFEYGASAPPLAYFFDSGIIARGLLALWRSTGDEEYYSRAETCARSMMRDFTDGWIHPVIELPSKRPLTQEGTWSRNPGCYQLKAAMAWCDLGEAGGGSEFCVAYETALTSALATHESFLPGDVDPQRVMDRLHAYCYFLEGLLPRVNRQECREALCGGVTKVGGYLRQISPLYAEALGVLPLDEAAASEEARRIRDYQSVAGTVRVRGGYWFGTRGGERLPYVNPVSTAFCLQARHMWEERESGALQVSRTLLI
jgi:hypothetical protein